MQNSLLSSSATGLWRKVARPPQTCNDGPGPTRRILRLRLPEGVTGRTAQKTGIERRKQASLEYRKRLESFLAATLSPQDALHARLLRYVLEQDIGAQPVSTYLQSFRQLGGPHTEVF